MFQMLIRKGKRKFGNSGVEENHAREELQRLEG